jgi:hypothetical protein
MNRQKNSAESGPLTSILLLAPLGGGGDLEPFGCRARAATRRESL